MADRDEHHELGFWTKYIFSSDHKTIGIQYGLTSLAFLLLGFALMMTMRWQLAYPGQPIPLIAKLFGGELMPGGVMTANVHNQLGAMHGTIMIFLGVVPLGVGAFGNYLVPLQIGAQEMAFPRLNMASFWIFFVAGIMMLASFFIPGGPASSGWTNYPPLSFTEQAGETCWLLAMMFVITASLLVSINFIATIIQHRAPGMSLMRMPFFVWAQFLTALLLLLAFPPLEGAAVLMLMDRVAGSSFFLPSALVLNGQALGASGGGNPLLWQHLFRFLAHPEVYVLILPALGIVAEIIANNTRKPLWGYKSMIYAVIFLGFMSFFVWGQHLFITGMGTTMATYLQTTTTIISIPSVIILTALMISLWGGSIRFNTPMLFALAFLPMFGIGALTGLPLGLAPTNIHLHGTYYAVGHFHYLVAPSTIFALLGGVYHWYPKAVGRAMSESLGKVHFWGSLLCMNGVFAPMLIQGLAGVSRRLYDGGASYAHAEQHLYLTKAISHSAWLLGAFQLVFIFNFFWSMLKGKKVNDNPWDATTLEWNTPTPPPHGNFKEIPTVYCGPYEYSTPEQPDSFRPQHQGAA